MLADYVTKRLDREQTGAGVRVLMLLTDAQLRALDAATGALPPSTRADIGRLRRDAGTGYTLGRTIDMLGQLTDEEARTWGFSVTLQAHFAQRTAPFYVAKMAADASFTSLLGSVAAGLLTMGIYPLVRNLWAGATADTDAAMHIPRFLQAELGIAEAPAKIIAAAGMAGSANPSQSIKAAFRGSPFSTSLEGMLFWYYVAAEAQNLKAFSGWDQGATSFASSLAALRGIAVSAEAPPDEVRRAYEIGAPLMQEVAEATRHLGTIAGMIGTQGSGPSPAPETVHREQGAPDAWALDREAGCSEMGDALEETGFLPLLGGLAGTLFKGAGKLFGKKKRKKRGRGASPPPPQDEPDMASPSGMMMSMMDDAGYAPPVRRHRRPSRFARRAPPLPPPQYEDGAEYEDDEDDQDEGY